MAFKNKTISISRDECESWAEEAFYQISGIYRETPGQNKIKEMAIMSFESIREFIEPKAVVSYFDKPIVTGGRIQLGEETLYCQALEQVKPDQVEAAFVYGLTIGDLKEDSDAAFFRLMVDFWGTAYVDASRYTLKERLSLKKESKNLFFSDELGPGFFGMGMSNAWKFSKLEDLSEVGIQLENKGVMAPEKSALGLFLLSKGESIRFGKKCLYCKGNEYGCKICMAESY